MKKLIHKLLILSTLSFSAISFAEDFSFRSNDELFDMREQVRTMDTETKDAYRTERQSRVSSMDQAEKDSRFGGMGASGRQNLDNMSQTNGNRKRDGSGDGQQKGKGRGNGGGSGGGGRRYGSSQ